MNSKAFKMYHKHLRRFKRTRMRLLANPRFGCQISTGENRAILPFSRKGVWKAEVRVAIMKICNGDFL